MESMRSRADSLRSRKIKHIGDVGRDFGDAAEHVFFGRGFHQDLIFHAVAADGFGDGLDVLREFVHIDVAAALEELPAPLSKVFMRACVGVWLYCGMCLLILFVCIGMACGCFEV